MAKRIMREFALDEISAVTMPAQKGAKMLIMKRDDGPGNGAGDKSPMTKAERIAAENARIADIVKRGKFRLTSPVNGHTHIVELDEFAEMRGGGYTEATGDYETPGRHRHPFILGPKGEITIGEEMGHTHEIADIPSKKAADVLPPDNPATIEKDEIDMDAKEVKKLTALSEMTDAQKAYFKGLSDEAAITAFIDADNAGREVIVGKAEAAKAGDNPVLFTTKAGLEIRKSDGPVVLAMAKQNDELMAGLSAAQAAAVDAKADALAKNWAHIGKPMAEKIEMAKGLLAIPDEGQRNAAIAGMDAGAGRVANLFKSFGAQGADGDNGEIEDPELELEKMTDEAVSKSSGNLTREQIYSKMLDTPKGAALYQQIVDAKDGQSGNVLH